MGYSNQLFQEKLRQALVGAASRQPVVVGLSGGLDSVVLLHGLVELRAQSKTNFRLRAFHVNHQLQDKAASWQQHCAAICKQWNVDFSSVEIDVSARPDTENAAREARYRAFEETLQVDELLLLAHHRDDQMETLLLRLMRGSGSRGLSGIPRTRDLKQGSLLRPMLDFDRRDLQRYAEDQQLVWVEDTSNQEQNRDRNYCRHRLLPLIESRWSGYRESWSKVVVLAQESGLLMQELAALDLSTATVDSMSILEIDQLMALSEPRRRNLLRYWLMSLGLPELGWNQSQRLSNEVLQKTTGAQFVGTGFQLRRYKNSLYVLPLDEFENDNGKPEFELSWNPATLPEIALPNNGSLACGAGHGCGALQSDCVEFNIRYRRSGESCRLAGRRTKSLKKILQEAGIEPWLRDRLPLLYKGDRLVCIPGVGVSEDFAAKTGEPGILLKWNRPDLRLHS